MRYLYLRNPDGSIKASIAIKYIDGKPVSYGFAILHKRDSSRGKPWFRKISSTRAEKAYQRQKFSPKMVHISVFKRINKESRNKLEKFKKLAGIEGDFFHLYGTIA